ncbi:MAG: hypothetical protein PVG70_04640 [Desulfobacterales bacterium]|jgi:hypothetical protein
MNIHIIQIPYDCGYKKVRQGLGSGRFIQQNLVQQLETEGHQVNLSQIEAHSKFTIEVHSQNDTFYFG